MRGDVIFQVYGVHAGRPQDTFLGAFRTREDANAAMEKLRQREDHYGNWAARYHDRGFVVRERVVETDFEPPPAPAPRQRYYVRGTPRPNRPGTWPSTRVEVFRRGREGGAGEPVCEYERHYGMLQTFEPFRQAGRDLALISQEHTRTAVLDLASGAVIAEEPPTDPPGGGFCPVGFYVPDWWDVHDDSIPPGSEFWSADKHEWPLGDFGFVWGCHWGVDSSWKVQYLDLSRVRDGVIARDERFGYVELATGGYRAPCLEPDATVARGIRPPPFIEIVRHRATTRVTFTMEMAFDLESGRAREWQRLRVENFE